MSAIAARRCFIHSNREAAALCVDCRRSFCRECVVDHEGRLNCKACLALTAKASQESGSRLAALTGPVNLLFALILCWFVFYMAGRALLVFEPQGRRFEEAGP